MKHCLFTTKLSFLPYSFFVFTQEIADNYQTELTGTEANLQSYWQLNDVLTDKTNNNNDLTNNNSVLFSTDIPFGAVSSTASIAEGMFIYSYNGDAGSNYANPHALTTVSSTDSNISYIYDNNGNLISYGDWSNTWDYNNRLLQSVNSATLTTTTYQYDQSGQKIKKIENGVVSVYPNKYYTIENGIITKHIFAGDTELASIEGTTTTYHHVDHLSGSSVETDEEGYVTEVLDYYPFGETRLDEKYTTYENDKKFTGHMYDDATGLYYMGARYQDPEVGRFVSEDPVFLDVGTQSSDENGQKQLRSYLSDPQGFSSYSYSRNNPLRYVDPTGEWFKEFFTGQQSWNSFQGEVGEATMNMSSGWQTAMDHPYATGAAVGVAGGVAAQALVASGVAGTVLSSSGAIRGGINAAFNVAGQVLDDQITGNRTSAGDYAKIAGISYLSGAVIKTNSVAGSAIGFGTMNVITQRATGDHTIDPVKVGGSALGGGFSTWAGNFAGRASNIGAYAAQQYGLSKIGWVLEAPISAIDSGIKRK